MSVTAQESQTLKHLRWVRDGGDHTHVNAPTAIELNILNGYVGESAPLVNYEKSVKDDDGEWTDIWKLELTVLGKYELARLEARVD